MCEELPNITILNFIRFQGKRTTANTLRISTLSILPLNASCLKKAGLPNVRFHDLRHTCATLLLTKGVPPKIVSEMLGHSSVAITLDTYTHVIPGLGEAAAGAMDEVLS